MVDVDRIRISDTMSLSLTAIICFTSALHYIITDPIHGLLARRNFECKNTMPFFLLLYSRDFNFLLRLDNGP